MQQKNPHKNSYVNAFLNTNHHIVSFAVSSLAIQLTTTLKIKLSYQTSLS